MQTRATMEFDGGVGFDVSVASSQESELSEVALEMAMPQSRAPLIAGMGLRGGYRPKEWAWKFGERPGKWAGVIVDPGLGFAKRAAHSYAALAGLERLATLDRPILVGPSRKSFLKEALGEGRAPAEREWGTAAAVAAAVYLGAHVVRVHGVREMVDVVRVADRLRAASGL